MIQKEKSFANQITANRTAERAPDTCTELEATGSDLSIRHRGCYITECTLTSASFGQAVPVLYREGELDEPKLTASHVMSPVGPSESIGGQHGFGRWADYHKFDLPDGPNDEKRISFQAKRPDTGLSLVKTFELTSSTLHSTTELYNSQDATESTSLGEHLYFSLFDEKTDGLKINGKSIDELLETKGATDSVLHGNSFFWSGFGGEIIISFPSGYNVKLTAHASSETTGSSVDLSDKLGMLIWHRPATESICFEPTLGFDKQDGSRNDLLQIEPYCKAILDTKIELL